MTVYAAGSKGNARPLATIIGAELAVDFGRAKEPRELQY